MSCFFFKQKTAYEMRISDWSSDVCSSDLHGVPDPRGWTSGESRSPRFQAVASTVADYGKAPGKTPSTGAYDHSQQVVKIALQIFERISGACADSSDSLVSFLKNRRSRRGVYRSGIQSGERIVGKEGVGRGRYQG